MASEQEGAADEEREAGGARADPACGAALIDLHGLGDPIESAVDDSVEELRGEGVRATDLCEFAAGLGALPELVAERGGKIIVQVAVEQSLEQLVAPDALASIAIVRLGPAEIHGSIPLCVSSLLRRERASCSEARAASSVHPIDSAMAA